MRKSITPRMMSFVIFISNRLFWNILRLLKVAKIKVFNSYIISYSQQSAFQISSHLLFATTYRLGPFDTCFTNEVWSSERLVICIKRECQWDLKTRSHSSKSQASYKRFSNHVFLRYELLFCVHNINQQRLKEMLKSLMMLNICKHNVLKITRP